MQDFLSIDIDSEYSSIINYLNKLPEIQIDNQMNELIIKNINSNHDKITVEENKIFLDTVILKKNQIELIESHKNLEIPYIKSFIINDNSIDLYF